MRFLYGKQDFRSQERGQESCWLVTNGLGGFSSQTITGAAARNDHAVFMACTQAPNHRWNVIHRLEEVLETHSGAEHLSSQQFRGLPAEDGWKHLCSMEVDGLPHWW
ncbi:MAG TPA: glycogen debranching enzyme N-terminal domain-containing protein, partial [Candidatus Anaerofilum excrementigallinarum]|nr:glycogen debranching enzyme N-terminal domain-containing protein [Candidatus Anaerofilum excrementigallinarum]